MSLSNRELWTSGLLYGDPTKMGAHQPRERKAPVKIHPSEWEEQCGVVSFARKYLPTKGIAARLLFSVPNGAHLAHMKDPRKRAATTQWLQSAGMVNGINDLILPVARKEFHSLYLEMKSVVGRVNPDQTLIHDLLMKQGMCVRVCYGAEQGIRALKEYLE